MIDLNLIFEYKPFTLDIVGKPKSPTLLPGQKILIPRLDDKDQLNKLRHFAKGVLIPEVSDSDLIDITIGQIGAFYDISITDNIVEILGAVSNEEVEKRFTKLERKYRSVYIRKK